MFSHQSKLSAGFSMFRASSLAFVLCVSAMQVAEASIQINENDFAPNDDFSSGFLNGPDLLPVGTSSVVGDFNDGSEDFDEFQFTGLLPGSSFTVSLEADAPDGVVSKSVLSVDFDEQFGFSSGLFGTFADTPGDPVSFDPITGIVPDDGNLVVSISLSEGEAGFYTVSLDAELAGAGGGAIPEPLSLLVWTGLAGVFGVQARRRGRET